jgi:hypothetical protein
MDLHLYPIPYGDPLPPPDLAFPFRTDVPGRDRTAFTTGLRNRDKFIGRTRCVICGESPVNPHRHGMAARWSEKLSPETESRNGLTMCANHHIAFDEHRFFIRYHPTVSEMIFCLYCLLTETEQEIHLY